MTTIIIDDKSAGAKKMIEFIKTLPYAKVIDERTPGASLKKSMDDARAGKTHAYKSTEDLFEKLRKKANV
jgi:hypothetical protein